MHYARHVGHDYHTIGDVYTIFLRKRQELDRLLEKHIGSNRVCDGRKQLELRLLCDTVEQSLSQELGGISLYRFREVVEKNGQMLIGHETEKHLLELIKWRPTKIARAKSKLRLVRSR